MCSEPLAAPSAPAFHRCAPPASLLPAKDARRSCTAASARRTPKTAPSSPTFADGPVLAADDLVRGYRIDVWDSLTSKWHSLCRRDGTCDFENGALIRHLDPDEGSTALATSQSADGTSQDLYLRIVCSTARAGWSLTVPRIGKTVGPQDTAAAPENPAQTEFKLVVSFKPVVTPNDSRLPQLRRRHLSIPRARRRPRRQQPAARRVQFRPVSVSPQPVAYLRYEPVAAPVVVLRAALSPTTTPGESVERIVIRSNFNTPAAVPSEHHLAPAKVSQEMVEVHGMFDGERPRQDRLHHADTEGRRSRRRPRASRPAGSPSRGAAGAPRGSARCGALSSICRTRAGRYLHRSIHRDMAERAAVPHRAGGRRRRAGAPAETTQERCLTVRIEGSRGRRLAEAAIHHRRAVEVGDLGLDPGSRPAQSGGPAATGRERRALDAADAAAFPDLGARGALAAHRAAIPES